MVNPSTADENTDDATIRKVRRFTELMGYNRFIVGNLFAYRATDVREIKRQKYPVGPENFDYLAKMIEESDRVIFAWGSSRKLPKKLHYQYSEAAKLVSGPPEKGPYALGLCNDGQPRHPLTAPYAKPPEKHRRHDLGLNFFRES